MTSPALAASDDVRPQQRPRLVDPVRRRFVRAPAPRGRWRRRHGPRRRARSAIAPRPARARAPPARRRGRPRAARGSKARDRHAGSLEVLFRGDERGAGRQPGGAREVIGRLGGRRARKCDDLRGAGAATTVAGDRLRPEHRGAARNGGACPSGPQKVNRLGSPKPIRRGATASNRTTVEKPLEARPDVVRPRAPAPGSGARRASPAAGRRSPPAARPA